MPSKHQANSGQVTEPKLRKIVLTIGQLGQGGAEGQVSLMAQELQRRDIEVTVVSMFAGGPYERILANAGVRVILGHFPSRATIKREPQRVFPAVSSFVRHLVQGRPDVVHGFLYHAYVPTVLAARLAKVPLIVTGRRSLGIYKEDRRWMLAAERCANRLTDAIIANSHAVKADALRQEHVSRSKVHVIHNGLPPSAFEQVPAHRMEASHPVIVSVGNLKPYKGHSELVQAAGMLQAKGMSIVVAIIGEGPMSGEIVNLARELGVDLRLFAGVSDVRPHLRAADVFVLPSHQEGFSNALLEAMAQGLPIVATDVGGNAEALRDVGVLVPARDVAALALAIEGLLLNPAARDGMAAMARQRAEDCFSIRRTVDEHVDLYERLLAVKAARGV